MVVAVRELDLGERLKTIRASSDASLISLRREKKKKKTWQFVVRSEIYRRATCVHCVSTRPGVGGGKQKELSQTRGFFYCRGVARCLRTELNASQLPS